MTRGESPRNWAEICCFGCTCLQLFWPKVVMRKWLNISAKESDYSADTDNDDYDSDPESQADEPSTSNPQSRTIYSFAPFFFCVSVYLYHRFSICMNSAVVVNLSTCFYADGGFDLGLECVYLSVFVFYLQNFVNGGEDRGFGMARRGMKLTMILQVRPSPVL